MNTQTLQLLIFDEITSETARTVREQLLARPQAPVTVRINSYGGDLAAAQSIFSALRLHRGSVAIVVEGIAASAATLFVCAGYSSMAENAALMIHAPWVDLTGNVHDLRNAADGLDTLTKGMISAYCAKTGKSSEAITPLLDGRDHWFTAAEAKAFGFIDEVLPALRVAARLGSLKLPERFVIMSEINPVKSVTTDTDVQAAVRREFMAAEQQRRQDIRNLLGGSFARRQDLVAVLNECLDDVACTVDEASRRLLKRAGADASPLGGWSPAESIGGAGAVGASVSTPHGSLFREFQAAERIRNPVGFGGHHRSDFLQAASDALAIRFGAKLKKPHPGAQDLKHHGLTGFAALVMANAGYDTVGMSRPALVKGAMTLSDFPELLGISANKVLGTRLEQIAQEHRDLCEKGDLVDFKPQKVVNPSFLPGLVRKLEHGEIEYGYITDGATSYQLMTFARGLAFSREVLINDDLDGIGILLRNASTSAARLERDLIFSILTGNPQTSDENPLFSVAHANLDTSGAAIDIAGLSKARVLMRKQKDSSGGFVLTSPKFLVTPVNREAEAEALVSSLSYRPSGGAEMETPSWVKNLVVISDPRLDAVSETHWYLLSDPAVAPTIKLGYLNGKDTPDVEQDADFNSDVMKFKIRFDVACTAVGWSGAVKMA